MDTKQYMEHPEGGRFKEVFRSDEQVVQGNRTRSALTHIYFSLKKDEVSRFHRVESDEVWNLYEGALILYLWDETAKTMETIELSSEKREYCCVVKAGLWQAAAPINTAVLVGCSVAPGFEFEDFKMIDSNTVVGKDILEQCPHLKKLVHPGC